MNFSSNTIMESTVIKDNNGALGLAIAPRKTPSTRHIAVKYQSSREHVGEENFIMIHRMESK